MTARIFDQNTELNTALEELTAGEVRWADLSLAGRVTLLDELRRTVSAAAREWVAVAAAYKGLDPDSPLLGEEWLSGPYAILTFVAALTDSVRALDGGGSPVDGFRFGRAPGGRITVEVLPHDNCDALLLNGFSAQVWMRPGVTRAQVTAEAGLGQRTPTITGGIGVVLGAGNITSIPLLDVLSELFAHNRVVALKLNPLTDPLRPVLGAAFAPLIAAGFLRIVAGGADVGQYLVHHRQVRHVHITGSAASHDAIVFGSGIDGSARRAAVRQNASDPLLDKPISSELGGVSPIIVLPGRWSTADLRFQAEHVATQRLHNGGYNCIAGQVLMVSADWPQRAEFLGEVRAALASAPERPAYYPGSDHRVAAAKTVYPQAESFDGGRLLIHVGTGAGQKAFHVEYFAPVLAVVELPGTGRAFLQGAVQMANDRLVGTLGANIIAHPRTIRAAGAAFDEAVAALRYGCVAVNVWTGFGFLTARGTWGAFPGHPLVDVQSGRGVVHNALLLDHAERTVVRGPFRPWTRSWAAGEFTLSPLPPWFVNNRTQATTGRRLTRFAAEPRWTKLPGILVSALRG